MALLTHAELRDRVERLCALERESGSPGERRGAELIAAELRALGARTRLEPERVHGTFWWPIGLLTAAAALSGLRGGRPAAAVGIAVAVAVADDIRCDRQLFRTLLPRRTTHNVVAELGDPSAEQTVVLVAHHDAPHTGLVFHPELPRAPFRLFPGALERAHTSAPTMWAAVGGPALVGAGAALGRRRLRLFGSVISGTFAAAMANIGASRTVPGANDNASAVAAMLSTARHLAAEPPPGLRVLVVATGSEESFQEGMQAFWARHGAELSPETTTVINFESVGSPELLVLEGEGMLGVVDYTSELRELAAACAEEIGVRTRRGLRLRNATDGLIPLKLGYPTLTLSSVDEFKAPTNYHWPTDVPGNVHYETVDQAARTVVAVVESLAGS